MVVDDHPLFRRGVVATLNAQPDMQVVGEASNGYEALERVRELVPDLILMDIQMPDCDGLEATRLIMDEMPYARIVMLTVSDDDQCLFEAIKAGAQGFLLKNLEPEDLAEMVWGVFRGEAPISRTTASRILREFGRQARGENISLADLSAREREVLGLVAQGLSNQEIAQSLTVSVHTVKNHLRNVLDKLHLENRVQAAVFAVRQGLIENQ
ncbi:MAG: DNA-binding response regulator [Anaerolineaceae bacterium 4572_32.1]|nr:MAG: DNA-binding response regulator [Anaerolineaceae bacterium 4572_32.1]